MLDKYRSINFLVCSFAPLPLGEGPGVNAIKLRNIQLM